MQRNSGSHNPVGPFGALWEATRDFPFSKVEGEPKDGSEDELHTFRLGALITSVRKIGQREYMRMPASFRAVHLPEDGGQQALEILLRETARYKPKEGYTYNGYMLYIVRKRLLGVKRDFYRRNPRILDDLREVIASLKRRLGSVPTVREIADHTGLDEEDLRSRLDSGPAMWAVRASIDQSEEMDGERDEVVDPSPTPEMNLMLKELLEALSDCLDQLSEYARLLLMERYFNGRSYNEISKKYEDSYETIRNRCRRSIEALRDCIKKKCGKISDFSEVAALLQILTRLWKEPARG